MAQIDVVNVQKYYGNYHALRDVSLSISQGEFLVLVGPSGCGKSTLLRSIAGLEDISGGIIAINGDPINDSSPQERNMAMVFQNYALYPHMTVRENLAFSLKLHKFSKSEIEERVNYAARMLGLSDYLSRRPKALSGGQRQRVAMGRAMVRKPAAFLFDEPLSNLDAKLRVSMRAEIRRLQRELGATAIYVTHDQVEAMTMGDRIAVVNHGGLEQVGTPLELYNDPDNKFVAGFIGSPPMNFISAQADGEVARLATGEQIKLPVKAKGNVTLGIRPEHLCLVGKLDHHEISVRIDRHFNLGAQTQLFCDLMGEEIEVTLNGSVDSIRDDSAKLKFDINSLFVFNEKDQRVR